MSRTTKDQPAWVEQNNPTNWVGETHRCNGNEATCDLHDQRTDSEHEQLCSPVLSASAHLAPAHTGSHLVRHDAQWVPERARVRAILTRLLKQHRSTQEIIDVEALNVQRHAHYAGRMAGLG